MKYTTMTNNEIVLSLCARIKETRMSLSMSQQQLALKAHVGIATIKRIEKGGSLNLDTLISILRALNKLNNLDAILFESEMRNFKENQEKMQEAGKLKVKRDAADLNKKSPSPYADETDYSTTLENSLHW